MTYLLPFISLGILLAWIYSDRQRLVEINRLWKQCNEAEDRCTKYALSCQQAELQAGELLARIGCPAGVVFLPEKTFWEDHQTLTALCEKYAQMHQEKHQKLVSIYNYITDSKGGPMIGEPPPLGCGTLGHAACKPKKGP